MSKHKEKQAEKHDHAHDGHEDSNKIEPGQEVLSLDAPVLPAKRPRKKMYTEDYEKELAKLNIELVKFQEWIKAQGLKVVIIFEGRDAAGK